MKYYTCFLLYLNLCENITHSLYDICHFLSPGPPGPFFLIWGVSLTRIEISHILFMAVANSWAQGLLAHFPNLGPFQILTKTIHVHFMTFAINNSWPQGLQAHFPILGPLPLFPEISHVLFMTFANARALPQSGAPSQSSFKFQHILFTTFANSWAQSFPAHFL